MNKILTSREIQANYDSAVEAINNLSLSIDAIEPTIQHRITITEKYSAILTDDNRAALNLIAQIKISRRDIERYLDLLGDLIP